jgi:uncharacterized protein YciI
MHALILMSPSGKSSADAEVQAEHEQFIGELDQANKVVLGGSWSPSAGTFEGGYVLTCESLEEAREIALSDPLVRADAIQCDVVEWELVGVNQDAVDRSSLLYP